MFVDPPNLTPFEHGQWANHAGEPIEDNPYDAGTPEHTKWVEGWNIEQRIKEDRS